MEWLYCVCTLANSGGEVYGIADSLGFLELMDDRVDGKSRTVGVEPSPALQSNPLSKHFES
jgi:hypothetical protein